jgi:hypothetical protein
VQVLAETLAGSLQQDLAHSSLGYRSPPPEAWAIKTNLTRRKEQGIATHFPALHTRPAAIQVRQKLRQT